MEKANNNSSFDFTGIIISLWKRKVVIIPFVLLSLALFAVYYYSRPLTYTASATVKVGKVAHIKVESYPDIMIYSKIAAVSSAENNSALSVVVSPLNMYSPDDVYGTLLMDISVSSGSNKMSRRELELFLMNFIERHRKIYDSALSNMKKKETNISAERAALLYLDSYTFPTQILGGVRESVSRSGLRGADPKRSVSFYFAVIFVLSLAVVSSAVVMFDFFIAEFRRRSAK